MNPYKKTPQIEGFLFGLIFPEILFKVEKELVYSL